MVRCVDAGCEELDVEGPNGIAALTERLAFGRSRTAVGFAEPRQHDRLLSLVVLEAVGAAIGALQREQWGRLARREVGGQGRNSRR